MSAKLPGWARSKGETICDLLLVGVDPPGAHAFVAGELVRAHAAGALEERARLFAIVARVTGQAVHEDALDVELQRALDAAREAGRQEIRQRAQDEADRDPHPSIPKDIRAAIEPVQTLRPGLLQDLADLLRRAPELHPTSEAP